MPKIIFTSRYIKGGAHSGNLVNYMATRDGVALPYMINGSRPATQNQQRLIDEIIRAVPEAAGLFEYEDYLQAPTVAGASALITTAFEQNPVLWDSVRNYVEYIARRPGVQKSSVAGHGLWNDSDQPAVLTHAVDEVANHKGNIWTHVVSLRREDAERMGYNSVEPWRNLVLEQLPTIAEAMKIPPADLRWYAAYHDKDSNPHIHLVVYSADPSRGYLTEPGIEKMRSAFAHSLYRNEFAHIYERKDQVRSQLNQFADERLSELAVSIDNGDPEISRKLLSLGEQLWYSKGKKQYGYLKPALKNQVDEIVRRLAADPHIDEIYRHWCDLAADVKRVYTSKIDAPPPLEHEKTFKTIKNMVVRHALEAAEQTHSLDEPGASGRELADLSEQEDAAHLLPEPEQDDEGPEPETDTAPAEGPELAHVPDSSDLFGDGQEDSADYHASWSPNYKQARRYLFSQGVEKNFPKAYALFLAEAEEGNALALHDLGYMHQKSLGMDEDMETAQAWYAKAYRAFCAVEEETPKPYLQYRIAKLHRDGLGTGQSYEQAAIWFDKSAEQGHQYAQYSLGSLYRRGLGVEHDDAKALRLFTLSAGQGNAYAAYELAGMYEKGIATAMDADAAHAYYKQAFHAFLTMEEKGADDKLQYRIGKMLLDGKGVEVDIEQAAAYFTKAAEGKNAHAQYALAKLILEGKVPGDRAEALGWMKKSAERGNELAQYQLGKLYLRGDGVEQDNTKATEYFTLSAAQGNEYAQWFLDHMNDYRGPSAGTLLRHLANMIRQDYEHQRQRYEQAVDHKLMAKIRRKKQDLGQRMEGE